MNSIQIEAKKPNKFKQSKKKKIDLRKDIKNEENNDGNNKIGSLGIDKKDQINQENNSNKKNIKTAVVSVKKFMQPTETDEVTKLFRSMIGIDNNLDLNSIVIRQFACRDCYRSWWRRVRTTKPVSICTRCRLKYDPVPFEKEFGTCEFNCTSCSSIFYKWCSKDSFIQCRNCNTDCKPIKILISYLNNRTNHLQSFNTASCSSSSSNSSIVMDGALNTHLFNTNNSINATNQINNNAITDLNLRYSNRIRFNNSIFYSNKVRCLHCNDTYLNLNSTIIFRPQQNPINKSNLHQSSYSSISSNRYKSDLSFCSHCRKIPIFSDQHISTGSTLGSLSYQGDLEFKYLDDEIDNLETCIEQSSEEETIK